MESHAPSGRAAVPTVPDRRRPGKNTLPDQRTLLTWLFVGRLVLATGVLLGAGLVWTERPQESFIVSVAVVFALVFTVTKGGPGYATTPFDLMIYRKAFESGELGYASALSVILFGIVLAVSAVQLRVFDRLTTDA